MTVVPKSAKNILQQKNVVAGKNLSYAQATFVHISIILVDTDLILTKHLDRDFL